MFTEVEADKYSLSKRSFVYGVGINDAPYKTTIKIGDKKITCRYYKRWKEMLKRCYSKKCQQTQPYYKGCAVCDGWLTFSNFKSWMEKQDWEGKQLDKDILKPFNKLYSPDTCIFVSNSLNSIVTNIHFTKSELPLGVSVNKKSGNFVVYVNSNTTSRRYLGSYSSLDEACCAYYEEKIKTFKKIIQENIQHSRLIEGLERHLALLEEKYYEYVP